MKQYGMVWAYLFLTIIALTLMGMGRANYILEDTHSSVAVQQAGHSQAGEPLPVTPTPLVVTVVAAVTVTAQPTITTTPGLTPTATATVTFIPTAPLTPELNPFTPTPELNPFTPTAEVNPFTPTPELNPFTPTPTNTPLAIFLPSVVREDFRSLRNGDFEEGTTGWTEAFKAYGIIFSTDKLDGVLPHGGDWAAWLGGYNDEESSLTQTVTVPLDRPVLRYWYKVGAPADCAPGIATVNINEGNIFREYRLCDVDAQEWTAATINLSQYSEQTITLQFSVKVETSGAASSFYLDDIEWIAP